MLPSVAKRADHQSNKRCQIIAATPCPEVILRKPLQRMAIGSLTHPASLPKPHSLELMLTKEPLIP